MATSGIDFTKTFAAASAPKAASDKPKAQFWLNIGYDSGVVDDDGTSRFISLPQGIPLDTQEHVAVKGKNQEWKAFQAARNGLLDQIMAAAQSLEPGEDKILNLQIQLRRVNADTEETVDASTNPFAVQLKL